MEVTSRNLSTDVQILQDPAVTDIACGALNGLKMGDKTLTVRRATAKLVSFKSNDAFFFFQLFLAHIGLNLFVMVFYSSVQSKSEQENILVQAQQHIAMQVRNNICGSSLRYTNRLLTYLFVCLVVENGNAGC